MTKLEYWKSVENGDFIEACKNEGINLTSTNASDARKEFMNIDFDKIYPNLSWRELIDKLSNLFLVGLKLKSLTSYEYGKMFTLSARLEEESTWDTPPYHVSYEGESNYSKLDELDNYIIKGCRIILRSIPLSDLKSAISKYTSTYGELNKNDETSWVGLIYVLFKDDENGSFEADSYIMGKIYEVLKAEGLEKEFITNVLCNLIAEINHYDSECERDEYDSSLRPYILDEDPKYTDHACCGVNDYPRLPKLITKSSNPIRTEDELDDILRNEYEIEYEDENNDENFDKSETEPTTLNSNVINEISEVPDRKDEDFYVDYNKVKLIFKSDVAVLGKFIEVANSETMADNILFVKYDYSIIGIQIKGGRVSVNEAAINSFGLDKIKDVLIRISVPRGLDDEAIELYNKYNEINNFMNWII